MVLYEVEQCVTPPAPRYLNSENLEIPWIHYAPYWLHELCFGAISVQDIILAQIPVVVVPCPCHVPPGPSMSDLTNKAGSFVFLLKFGPWLRKPLLFHFGSHSKDTYTLQGHLSKKFDWSCSENSFLIAHFLLHFWGSVGPGMLGRHCWVSIHMFPRLIRPSGWIFLIYIL